jgi:galactokinase
MEALAGAGFAADEAAAAERLAAAATRAQARLTSRKPTAACWVPGRLELFGTHTDYAGGRTLVAALPRGFIFTGAARRDRDVRVIDAIGGEQVAVHPGHGEGSAGWRHYAATVVHRLARNFPDAPIGADVSFASDLPQAAGMSSSSALMVGLAVTLIRLSGVRGSAAWRENIANAVDEAGYYACIENGRDFRALAGDAGVGTHGGSEDHAAMLCSTPGAFTALSFVPMRLLTTAPLPDGWSCIVAASGVAAEKTGRALDAYNRLSSGAAALLDLANRGHEKFPSLAAALASPSGRQCLQEQLETADVIGWSVDALRNRLRHFVREDARIQQAVDALRTGDAPQMRELGAQSQADSDLLLGNQVAETNALSTLALDHGAFASRSFGAGFGGSVWAVVERSEASEFASRWRAAYRSRFPARVLTVFAARPGCAMVELGPN